MAETFQNPDLAELVAENNKLLRENNDLLKSIDDRLRKIAINTSRP